MPLVALTARDMQILGLSPGECVGCSALRAAAEPHGAGFAIRAARMEPFMQAHLTLIREADALGEHDAALAARTLHASTSVPRPDPDALLLAGIRVLKTVTKPSKPGKAPRDVWEVTAPPKWHGMLYALKAKKWRGAFSFWDDPTDRILHALQTTTPESYEERIEGKNERSLARAERLEDLSQKREAQAAASWRRSDEAVRSIPPGQPVLKGHHSQRRHERDQKKSHDAAFKALDLEREAKDFAHRAEGALGRVEEQEDIGYMQRRLKEAETNLRKVRASLTSTGEDLDAYAARHGLDPHNVRAWRANALARQEEYSQAIAYWTKRIEEAGGIRFSRADFTVGDLIRWSHGAGARWLIVLRVNPTTLKCCFLDAGTWEPMVPYAEIREHVKPAAMTPEQRETIAKLLATRASKAPPRRKKGGTGVFTAVAGGTLEAQATTEGMTFHAQDDDRCVELLLPWKKAFELFRALSKELGLHSVAESQGDYSLQLDEGISVGFSKSAEGISFALAGSGRTLRLTLNRDRASDFARRGRDFVWEHKDQLRPEPGPSPTPGAPTSTHTESA